MNTVAVTIVEEGSHARQQVKRQPGLLSLKVSRIEASEMIEVESQVWHVSG